MQTTSYQDAVALAVSGRIVVCINCRLADDPGSTAVATCDFALPDRAAGVALHPDGAIRAAFLGQIAIGAGRSIRDHGFVPKEAA